MLVPADMRGFMSFTGFMGVARRVPGGARGRWRLVVAVGVLAAAAVAASACAAEAPDGWMVVEYARPDDWSCVATEPCVDCTNTADETSELRVRRGDGAVRAHLVAPGARVRICAGGGA